MKKFLYENSLSLVMFALFLGTLGGQIATGLHEYNSTQEEHGQSTVAYSAYLRSGHFLEGGKRYRRQLTGHAPLVYCYIREGLSQFGPQGCQEIGQT